MSYTWYISKIHLKLNNSELFRVKGTSILIEIMPKCILMYTKSTINSALNYSKLKSTKLKAVSYLAVTLNTKV